jgi:N-acetyl-alpha-D-glucosaminyl L-malate synthase BshA
MKIAIACHPTQGGSGIVATELAMGLAGRGHEVHLISYDRPFRLPQDAPVRFHRVNVPDYPLFRFPPHDLSLVNKYVEVICDHDLDIVHAHYAVPHAMCAILANNVVQPHRVRIVATLHGTDITLVGSHPDFFKVCRHTMLEADGLTAVSMWLRERTLHKFRIPRAPDVIHNFVEVERFHPRGRAPYPAQGPFQIVHVSNFRPVKRTADVVRVFHAISKALPARLVLAGEGPDLGLARELCAELGISERVEYAGARIRIEELLRQSHLFLLLSDYESFGLSALEAMACGTPVAVSRAGGLGEVVEDGETGLLCPVGGVEETARRCAELLKDRERWERTGERAWRTAHDRFPAAKLVAAYEEYYEEILSRGRME